jgi:P-type Mg2+ transporter
VEASTVVSAGSVGAADAVEPAFWSQTRQQLFRALDSSPLGLNPATAARRLRDVGPNAIREEGGSSAAALLAKQFASPLVLILVFGAIVSLALRDTTDAIIIIVIVGGSALLSFWQEWRASQAVQALKARLALSSRVVRSGKEAIVPAADIVPGDVVLLSAGNLIPADGLILEAQDFLVTQAALTGESMPVEKKLGTIRADAPISECTNSVFMGSSVRSGSARVLIVRTGARTEFGAIAARLKESEPETDFERGVRRFGTMLLRAMFVLVAFVLTVNALLGRPFVGSMLFAVALAVGLSPELLPAIVTVTLSAGARRLSSDGVIVRRLEALENFGSMNVLCTDKTGTITTGEVELSDAVDAEGQTSPSVKRLAYLNAALETGIANPLDQALVTAGASDKLDTSGVTKLDEIPYDFQRRRLTVVVQEQGRQQMITKGAFDEVLGICTTIVDKDKSSPLTSAKRARLQAYFQEKGEEGFRVLAMAIRYLDAKPDYTVDDERDLEFVGFLLFLDPPKDTARATLVALHQSGISTKIISGDNRHVTAHIANAVGLDPKAIIAGDQLGKMSEEALWHAVRKTDLFVEIEPQQKERIIRALQKAGNSVGYMGDGINDAPALRAADIGISVDDAVDVARESADIVLLKSDLGVLLKGVEDGRRTFANTMKYISIAISSNFGNMISMALATPLLPFLPLLPKQILLNNFLADLPALAISTDQVDPELLKSPQRWDVRLVGRFMVVFGLGSSVFDFLTFGALLFLFHAGEKLFHTGWFIESLLTQMVVVLVLRTRRFAWRSRPGTLLVLALACVFAAAVALPYTGALTRALEFVPLTVRELSTLFAIVAAYLGGTELLKQWFYRHRPPRHARDAGPRSR